MSTPAGGPLKGLRVLDCGTAVVGPWAATLLAFLGADVIKVERPSGEITRLARPHQNGWSTAYVVANLCKRSIELDFKDPANKKSIDRLLSQADVVIENYRPGVADRIGIGYAQAASLNPAVAYGSSSGWGDVGPMRDMSAVDSHLQAFSGFASLNGSPDGPPEMLRYTHIDPSGGTFLAAGLMLGLIGKQRFGHGAHIVTSHLAMTLAMQTTRIAETLNTGKPVPRLGSACTSSAPNQCFQTQDGSYIALGVQSDKQWNALCKVIGDDDLANDEQFKINDKRVANRDSLSEIIGEKIGNRPAQWWLTKLAGAGVPASLLLNGAAVMTHRHFWENDYLIEISPPHTGPMTVAGLPWRFSKTPASMDKPTPVPGSDTKAVCKTGFGDEAPVAPTATPQSDDTPPLKGMNIIELCQGIAGPHIGLFLAEAGATVTKIEPPDGDWTKGLVPASSSGTSCVYEALNRTKHCIPLDVVDPSDNHSIAERLSDADVILTDWCPDQDDALSALVRDADHGNKVILCLSDYGEKGPLAGHPASELTLQAMTGYLNILGTIDGAPIRAGADLAESAATSMGLLGILAALYHRERTGDGQTVSVSRLGALMSLRSLQWAAISNPDEWLGPSYCLAETDPPRHGYRTQDKNVFVSMMNLRDDKQFTSMLEELGMMNDVKDDKKFLEEGRTTIGMGFLSGTYHDLWERHLMRLPSKDVLDIFNRNGATAVDFPELDELTDHPQVSALELVKEFDGRRFLRAPWRSWWTYPETFLSTNVEPETTTTKTAHG